jgi:hypothetical protein
MVASAAVFAVIYAILGLIPVSAYVGVGSFLTFREILTPLAGMLFGPLTGGLSMVLGNFVDFAFGKPVIFDYLDFIPGLVSAVVAGLAFTGRRKLALALPVVLVVWYAVDPLSLNFVMLGGVPVPFWWMHLLSVVLLGVAFWLEGRGRIGRLNPVFVGATAFASTMAGHIAGSLMYENVLVRVNHLLTPLAIAKSWNAIFFLYPPERILFTILGTLVAVPVLRALAKRRPAEPKDS